MQPPHVAHQQLSHPHNLVVQPSITTPPIPLGFTTNPTRNSPYKTRGNAGEEGQESRPAHLFDQPDKNRFIRRRPRVKSDIKAHFAHSGKKFPKENKFKKTASRKVNLNRKERMKIEFIEPAQDETASNLVPEPLENHPIHSFPEPELFQPQLPIETPSSDQFIEHFFASPSTIRPVFFTASPTPDLYGLASTSRPFFAPTVKSAHNADPLIQFPLTIDPPPIANSFLHSQPSQHHPTNPFVAFNHPTIPPTSVRSRFASNRFSMRRAGVRGRNRIVVTTATPEPVAAPVLPTNHPTDRQKPPVKSQRGPARRSRGKKLSRVRVKAS